MPEDPCDQHRANQFAAADYADSLRPPDPTAPRDVACICEGKYTVRLVLTRMLKRSGVWEGSCIVCRRRYSQQEPMAAMGASQ